VLIAIGDIHATSDNLERLMIELKDFQNKSDDHTFIFLGDYVDRGPDAKGVVDYLLQFKEKNNCIFLKGNHEDMMLHPIDHGSWYRNGGIDTINSYKNQKDFENHLEVFYKRLWLKYETPEIFFCHAGVHPSYPLANQIENDLLWIRKGFLGWPEPFEKMIVHGHSVESLDKPVQKTNRINLDTGAVFGGKLTAALLEPGKSIITGGETLNVEFVQVDSSFTWKK